MDGIRFPLFSRKLYNYPPIFNYVSHEINSNCYVLISIGVVLQLPNEGSQFITLDSVKFVVLLGLINLNHVLVYFYSYTFM